MDIQEFLASHKVALDVMHPAFHLALVALIPKFCKSRTFYDRRFSGPILLTNHPKMPSRLFWGHLSCGKAFPYRDFTRKSSG
jgi:hypothetical protein